MLQPLKRMVGCGKPAHERRTSRSDNGGSSSSSAPAPAAPATAPSVTLPAPQPAWRARAPTREELEARRCVEKEFVSNHDTSDTDIWHLITMEWLNDWKRFVSRQGPLPGPIKNDLLVDSRTGKPLPGLQLVLNYRGVNNQIWDFWEQRYGGGPVIRRRQLDIYAQPYGRDGVSANGNQARSTQSQGTPSPQRAQLAPPLSSSNGHSNGHSSGQRGDRVVHPVATSPTGGAANNHHSSTSSAASYAGSSGGKDSHAWSSPERGAGGSLSSPEGFKGASGVSPAASEKPRRNCGGLFTAYRGGGDHASSAARQQSSPPTAGRDASSKKDGAATLLSPSALGREKVEDDAARSEPHPGQTTDAVRSPTSNAGGSPRKGGASPKEQREIFDPYHFVAESDGCIIAQPGDGSCLFHSLACGLDDGATASSLRQDISAYIAKNPEMVIADTTLKDWVKFDSGQQMKVSQYAAKIAGTTWGGGIEIEAFVRLRLVSVHVYETCPGGFKRIACFDAPPSCKNPLLISVLYQGREHYDALLLCQAPYDDS